MTSDLDFLPGLGAVTFPSPPLVALLRCPARVVPMRDVPRPISVPLHPLRTVPASYFSPL